MSDHISQQTLVPPHVGHLIDAAAGAGILAALQGWVPTVVAILGGIWYIVQIIGYLRDRYNRRHRKQRRSTDDFGDPVV